MLETETSYTAMLEIVWKPTQEPDPHFEQLRAEAATSGRLCVVNAIVSDLDRILILRRAHWKSFLPDCWDLPGGHVAPGESLEAALRREVEEEIGARICTIDALIAVWDWEHRAGVGQKNAVRQFEFMVTLAGPSCVLQVDPHDFSDYRWISESELPIMLENRAPGDTQMLEVLRRACQVRMQQK